MSESLSVELALRRREAALLRRAIELRKQNGIRFYSPHEKQTLFHSAAFYRYRYARTGNRFGKSEMGAAEDVAYAIGYRPWIPEGVTHRTLGTPDIPEEFLDTPLRVLGIPPNPTKGLIVTTDWDKSKEIFTEQEGENVGKLFKYIPADCLGQPTRNHSGAIDRIPVRHVSGGWSVIHLDTVKSYKQNTLGQESSAWDWAHIDEPIPEGMWKAIARGLVDRSGHAWFTCTPLTEPWIDEAFVPDTEDMSKESLNVIATASSSRWMMTGSMDDNPHNTAADIELFMSWLTEEERECRRSGVPTAYSGLVYKEFKWNTHVLRVPPPGWVDPNGQPSWLFPPRSYTIRFSIDYHPRKPHAVLFIATSPHEEHYAFAEIWRSCLMSELAQNIKEVLHYREPTVPGLIDPLASTPNRVTDITPLEEVLQNGLPVIPATKDPYNGILKVKEALVTRDRLGAPILRFASSCTHTLSEISRKYIWDKDTNKPLKQDDDMMENLYRLCLQGLTYVSPADDTDYAPIIVPDIAANIIDISEFEDPDATSPRSRRAARLARFRS